VIASPRVYDVYAVAKGVTRKIATTQSGKTTSEAFVEQPGTLDALQLRDGSSIVATALVR
jgi:hypothetical protein